MHNLAALKTPKYNYVIHYSVVMCAKPYMKLVTNFLRQEGWGHTALTQPYTLVYNSGTENIIIV